MTGNMEVRKPSGIPQKNLDALRAYVSEVDKHIDNPNLPGNSALKEVAIAIRSERRVQEELLLSERKAREERVMNSKKEIFEEIKKDIINLDKLRELVGIVGVNASINNNGDTTLMFVSVCSDDEIDNFFTPYTPNNHEEAVKLLLSLGANPTLKNDQGWDALAGCRIDSMREILKAAVENWQKQV
jgi:hypothetical protein